MLNLFINYDCNLACDYCFVRGSGQHRPPRIGEADFERFCRWLECHRVPVLGILGGEPTLHPNLAVMLERLRGAGVASVLFTNALYPDDALTEVLARTTATVVVNYNEPGQYPRGQWERAQRHIGDLVEAGAKVSFSKNFSPGQSAFDYLIEGCRRFGVTRVRYDVSRPNRVAANNHFARGEEREVVHTLLAFVRSAEEAGILTGLDCCLPLCDFTVDELAYLREHSMRFNGVCQPSLDVQTDLSVSYCMPLSDVRLADVCACAGEMELLCRMSALVRARRASRPAGCGPCEHFGRSCQGGCLALRALGDWDDRENRDDREDREGRGNRDDRRNREDREEDATSDTYQLHA